MLSPFWRATAFIGVFCLLIGVASPARAQASIDVKAEVDRTAVSIGDVVNLTVTVAGDYQQLGEPQLPLLSGFQLAGTSRSSQFSMVNGVVSSRTVFTYRLQPTGPGSFSIDRIDVVVDGSTYSTDPITIEVTQGAAPTLTPLPARPSTSDTPSGLQEQDLYVEATVDNSAPYVGQQIIYTFRFYQGANLFDQPRLNWPAFSGYWSESLSPNNVYEQTVGQRTYRVTEVRQALFPTAAGQGTIEPTSLTVPGGLFRNDVVLKTEPVDIVVRPLPAGAPEGFVGAVGQYELESWIEPKQGRVNEPLTWFVRVQGAGNLTAVPDPTQDAETLLPDWRVYAPQTTTNVSQDGDIVQGEKVFERLLVPKVEGDLEIPGVSLVFFDPEAGVYRLVETEPHMVQIAPGEANTSTVAPNANAKQQIEVLASDIRHIKAAPPALETSRTAVLERPLYWVGWLLPPLAVVGVWTWERRRRRLSADVAYARSQRASREARKRLSQARRQARENQDAAYATVARALTDFVGDKLNLSSTGLTHDAIRRRLTDRSVPEALTQRALLCLDWADSGRFAPVAAGRDVEGLISEAETLIDELERSINHRERAA